VNATRALRGASSGGRRGQGGDALDKGFYLNQKPRPVVQAEREHPQAGGIDPAALQAPLQLFDAIPHQEVPFPVETIPIRTPGHKDARRPARQRFF